MLRILNSLVRFVDVFSLIEIHVCNQRDTAELKVIDKSFDFYVQLSFDGKHIFD